MSGVEVAGLILGAVPMTIAALEQYKTAHGMLITFRNKSALVERLIGVLKEQKFELESEFALMLRAAGYTSRGEDLQAVFLRNDIAETFCEYLGPGYDPYRNALVRCQTSLEDIVRKIRGLVPGSPSGDLNELLKANGRKDGRYEFRKGIKFSLNKDGLERRISHLRTAIKDLGKLRELNALLHDNGVQSCSRTMKEFSSFLQRVQRHADSLYGAIAHGLSSGCHYEHGTRFYLEGQSAILQKKPLPINFELALETPEAPIVGRNLHHEIRIEVLEDDMDRSHSQQGPERSVVRFNLPEPWKAPDPLMTDVQNLCLSLDQARQESRIMKVFLSPHGGLCSRYLSPYLGGGFVANDSTYGMITLEQVLLHRSNNKSSRLEWNLIQRMNLSFSLASSLLQLYSTPWLSEPWTKRTIFFWRHEVSSQAKDTALSFEPNRPFITQRFSDPPAARPKYKVEPRYQLLDLGIVLLEIRQERSIESWASSHNIDLDSSYGSRYSAASMWLRGSVGELEPSYFDAVARCIEFTFQTHPVISNWEDSGFRKSVCELVLKPLWSNCSTV